MRGRGQDNSIDKKACNRKFEPHCQPGVFWMGLQQPLTHSKLPAWVQITMVTMEVLGRRNSIASSLFNIIIINYSLLIIIINIIMLEQTVSNFHTYVN